MQMFIGTTSTECSICLGDFRDPRYLPCGHTFCTPCIQELVNWLDPVCDYIALRIFRCPLCRNIVEVAAEGAEGFPRDVKVDVLLANITVEQLACRQKWQFAMRRAELLDQIGAEQEARERFEQLAEIRAHQAFESRVMELAERGAKEFAEKRAKELAERIATQETNARRIVHFVAFLLIVVAGLLLHGYYQGSEKLNPCLDTVERLKRTVDDLKVRQKEDLLMIERMEEDIVKEKTDSLQIQQLKADIASRDELKPTYDLALIKTYEDPTGSQAAAVMTLIDGKLLIANSINGELKLQDAYSVTKESNWTTIPSSTVAGMGICPKNGQVFVSTWNKYIYRFNRDGEMLDQWPVETSGTISVTKDCNVALAVQDNSTKILIYSFNGERIREIRIKSDIRKSRLIKAVPLSKGSFIVSYGEGDDPEHGIKIINANGDTLMSYGGRKNSRNHQLNFPRDFVVDRFGNVLVVDSGNKRILLLDSKLKFQMEILSTKHGLQYPSGILLNECENRLYVSDNEWEPTSEKWTNGRIMEFNTK